VLTSTPKERAVSANTTFSAFLVDSSDRSSRQAVTTGPSGQTRTLDDVTQRTDGGFTRSTVITNPDGSTVTREVEATYDPETGSWSKDVNVDRE
jgi:hypothetical protein